MIVHIPSPLFSYTGGQRRTEVEGGTLDEVLTALDRRFPGLRFRIVDEQDRIRQHILIYVNGEVVQTLGQPIQPTDEVHIIAALSGGIFEEHVLHSQN